MSYPTIATVYSSEDEIRRHLGELGVDQQVSDIDELEQDGTLAEYIASATTKVDFLLGRFYAPAALVTSRKVWDWTTSIAIYLLFTRRAQTPPAIVRFHYTEAMREMELVATGKWIIPGLAKTSVSAPIVHDHGTNPHAIRNTQPVALQNSLDESGKVTTPPYWFEPYWFPFDWI